MNPSKTTKKNSELPELIAALLDGAIGDEEFAELDRQLRNDAEARQLYLDYVQMDQELPDIAFGLEPEYETNDESLCQPIMPQASSSRLKRSLTAIGGAILLGLALFLGGQLWLGSPTAPSVASPERDQAQDVQFVSLAHAEFYGELAPAVASAPELLRDYVLKTGMVELAFPKRARAIIEGPAVFRVVSSDKLALDVGRCSVHAPEGAEGFQVETPEVDVVDRGTRFAVEVSEQNSTDVQVVEGAADVYQKSDDGAVRSYSRRESRLRETEAVRFDFANGLAARRIPFNQQSYLHGLPDRVISYEATRNENGRCRDLVSVTVQRGGMPQTVPVEQIIPVEVLSYRGLLGRGCLAGEAELPPDRRMTLSDRSLITGIINPGGSELPLTTDPIIHPDEEAGEEGTPGMAIRFERPVVNDAGPDIVLFELQSSIYPSRGDSFHVSPLQFEEGLRTHTVRSFDLTMESRQSLELVDFYVYTFPEIPHSLNCLQDRTCSPTPQAIKFRALAVGIDLSDLGYQAGATVSELFIQDALDDEHTVDPVFIGGLPEIQETTEVE